MSLFQCNLLSRSTISAKIIMDICFMAENNTACEDSRVYKTNFNSLENQMEKFRLNIFRSVINCVLLLHLRAINSALCLSQSNK